MVSRSKLIVAGILFLVASVILNQAVSAAVPNALLPTGTTRYAFVRSSSAVSTTSTSFVNLPGLSTSITIPAGKVGDVMVYFCGQTITESFTTVRVRIGATGGPPSETQIRENTSTGGGETQCAQFAKANIPSGTHTVRMQWRGSTFFPGDQQQMFERSMIVVANIH